MQKQKEREKRNPNITLLGGNITVPNKAITSYIFVLFFSSTLIGLFVAALTNSRNVQAAPLTGANSDIGQYWVEEFGFVDGTAEANSPGDTDDVPWPMVGGGVALQYYGHATLPFTSIFIDAAGGFGTANYTWEYWDGASWSALSVTNVTDAYTTDGIHEFSFTAPGDWATTSVNSESGSFYYVRSTCNDFCQFLMVDQISLLTESSGSAPTVDSVTITTSTQGAAESAINLNENTTKSVYIHGNISDSDGCSDFNNGTLTGTFYRSGVGSAETCTADNNNCYRESYAGNCSITGCSSGTETTVQYECVYSVQHYADPTDSGQYSAENWVGHIRIEDQSATEATGTDTIEINSLAALDVTSIVDFGSLGFSVTSSEQTVSVTNTGNRNIDIDVTASNLSCSIGDIPDSAVRYASSTGSNYEDMTSLSSTTPSATNITLSKQTSGSASTDDLYFRLLTPPYGISGACSGIITHIANAQ